MNTPSHNPLFGRIALIGTGLIGSSIAHAIHSQNLAEQVTVAARSQATLDIMLKLGLTTFATLDVSEAVKNAEEWLDSHPVEEAEVYQSRTKSLQEVVSPVMSKLHEAAASGMPGGMPGGMPDMGGMPQATPSDASETAASVEEVD